MSDCMFPLCRCYVFSDDGEVVVTKTYKGHYRTLAHNCENEDCDYPRCQDGTCAQLFPPDYFASCKKRK